MQWKMAENSLFAILLRSPWWVSAAVTFVIASLSFVLLPTDYVIFGLALALPFPVIAAVSGWRQMQAPSAGRVQAITDTVSAMNWKDFSRDLTSAWESRGIEVEPLSVAGADFELTEGWRKTVVSARRWKVGQLGVEPVKALLAAREAREANKAMIITLGELSKPARKMAEARGVEISDGQELARLLPLLASRNGSTKAG